MSNILDPIIMFILFMIMILGLIIGVQVLKDATADPALVPVQYRNDGLRFFESIDNMGIFIVLAIIAVTIGSAYLIKTNPIFFVIAILLLAIQFIVLPPVINIFNSFVMSGGFDDSITVFPKTIWLIGLSPILSVIGGGLAAVAGLRGE